MRVGTVDFPLPNPPPQAGDGTLRAASEAPRVSNLQFNSAIGSMIQGWMIR